LRSGGLEDYLQGKYRHTHTHTHKHNFCERVCIYVRDRTTIAVSSRGIRGELYKERLYEETGIVRGHLYEERL
jgi:hypothetical protein